MVFDKRARAWCSALIFSNSSMQQAPRSASTSAPASNTKSPVTTSFTTDTVSPAVVEVLPHTYTPRGAAAAVACKLISLSCTLLSCSVNFPALCQVHTHRPTNYMMYAAEAAHGICMCSAILLHWIAMFYRRPHEHPLHISVRGGCSRGIAQGSWSYQATIMSWQRHHCGSIASSHLQQLALAEAGIAAHQEVDVAADGHGIHSAHTLSHAAQQRQHQPSLRRQALLSCRSGPRICERT